MIFLFPPINSLNFSKASDNVPHEQTGITINILYTFIIKLL